jgi:copper chaperone
MNFFPLTFPPQEGPHLRTENQESEMTMTKFHVPDMTCGHCKKAVEEALHGIDAAAGIEVDLDKHEISLTSSASIEQALAALKGAGYEATTV